MREILFRGKRKTDGEWVYGMPWIFKDHACVCPWKEGMCKYDTGFYPVRVDPDTVGQYVGLNDKTGKKIFEGDILSERGSLFLVVWDKPWARFKLQHIDRGIQYPEWNRGVQMEVVGNIHDNPELLGGTAHE